MNGDGFGDVIVGVPQYEGEVGDGRAVVFHGQRSVPRTQAGWVTESGQINAHYGHSVASIGDVNGDGYGDVLVGASYYDNGQIDEGVVFLFLGFRTGLSWIPSWWAEANQEDAWLGTAISGSGDVNGDGYPEVIVGAPGYTGGVSDEGAAFVWFSSPEAPLGTPDNADWSAFGGQQGCKFGSAVSGGGDFNGDGYSDVVVGAHYYTDSHEEEGAVFAYYGSETGPSASQDWFHGSNFAHARYGVSVAGNGDFNGDGFSDVLVGAPKYYVGDSEEGYAFVYIGSSDGLQVSAPWWNCKSNQSNAHLGESVAWAGDVNGDGCSDALVGAPDWNEPYTACGIAFLWAGSATAPPNGTPDNDWWSSPQTFQEYAHLGDAVASAGDVNGDGYSDILVGSHWIDTAYGEDAGKAYLYLGSETGIPLGPPHWDVAGQQADGHFASDLASAGDVNGDGFGDVIIGARSHSNGQSGEGRAFCYYGNDSRGLSRMPQQWHSDLSSPIAPLCLANDPHAFALRAHGRSPMGRSQVRMEYEVKPFGTSFDGSGTVIGDWTDTGAIAGDNGSFVMLSEVVSDLGADTKFHWRLRIHTDDLRYPHSPWIYLPYNGAGEMDLRTSGEGTAAPELPAAAARLHNYPNPFNPRTTLSYSLPAAVRVRLSVHDVQGRLLKVLVDGPRKAGEQAVIWDGRDESGRAQPSGVYFARLEAGELSQSRKMILVK
ncbi:MAG: FG-GAP repeat protein [Kiritimatiellae bacterium]|nr:FG-GAP repeat protein [Kiritimatiellia bacterium]